VSINELTKGTPSSNKRELPRIPLAPPLTPGPSPLSTGERGASGFRAFAEAGRELAKLHLDYEKLEPWPLEFKYTEGVPLL
jgi:predicted helicase